MFEDFEFEDKFNPWTVKSLDDFLFYCCPECDHQSITKNAFIKHAVNNHPRSQDVIDSLESKTNLILIKTENDDERQAMQRMDSTVTLPAPLPLTSKASDDSSENEKPTIRNSEVTKTTETGTLHDNGLNETTSNDKETCIETSILQPEAIANSFAKAKDCIMPLQADKSVHFGYVWSKLSSHNSFFHIGYNCI